MNRILTADVILTLTADDARRVLVSCREMARSCRGVVLRDVREGYEDVADLIEQQCAKQGAQL